MSTSTSADAANKRKAGCFVVFAVLLVVAGIGVYRWVTRSSLPQVRVTQASVTGFVHSSLSGPSTGPISVTLRGAPAASLYRVAERLESGNALDCMENAQLYAINFTSATGHIVVSGYQCDGWVHMAAPGKASEWTDSNCALLYAVRRLLPATATSTQRDPVPICS